MITYTASLSIICQTLDEFNKLLTEAQTAPTVSNIVSDVNTLTISLNINATG